MRFPSQCLSGKSLWWVRGALGRRPVVFEHRSGADRRWMTATVDVPDRYSDGGLDGDVAARPLLRWIAAPLVGKGWFGEPLRFKLLKTGGRDERCTFFSASSPFANRRISPARRHRRDQLLRPVEPRHRQRPHSRRPRAQRDANGRPALGLRAQLRLRATADRAADRSAWPPHLAGSRAGTVVRRPGYDRARDGIRPVLLGPHRSGHRRSTAVPDRRSGGERLVPHQGARRAIWHIQHGEQPWTGPRAADLDRDHARLRVA